jgi:hypothetical protein
MESVLDGSQVVAVGETLRLPALGLEASRAVFGEGEVSRSGERHVVLIVEVDEFAELQMAGERCGLRRDAFIKSPALTMPYVK